MATRRQVVSVAEGTALAFASRNNDVGGWWALGLLLAAVPPGDPDYQVDLLTGEATPVVLEPAIRELGAVWAAYLRWSLERHGVPLSFVRSAALTVRFDRAHEVPSWIPGGRDHPFRCSVTIEDDRSDVHERLAEGHCSRLDAFVDPDLRPRRAITRSRRPQ